MSISPGAKFGSYEIVEPIGVGGMGEVYRAKDPALGRDVAVKVLPESFASDAGRVARFSQEARTLASLNHPNVAHIYGLETHDATTAIVMELVEGPTLADRIEQGPLPADEALNIAMQIADALEAAHAQGIIHRDLKPANVKVRPDGTVKVLDFGIAKAFEPLAFTSGKGSPVMTTPVTQAGIILGTAAYMSPEQARGKPVDQRTDVWAFGCVLFEMLTGQPVFAGEDVSVTLARVLERDANLDSIPGAITPAVKHAIELCLRKDPRKRLHAIGDVRLALEGELGSDGADGWEADGELAASGRRRFAWLGAGLAAGAAIAAIAAFAVGSLTPAPGTPPVTRFEWTVDAANGYLLPTVSDDGATIAYAAGFTEPAIYLRDVGDFEPRRLDDSAGRMAPNPPCFSPDGKWVAYSAASYTELRKAPVAGGRGLTLAEDLPYADVCDWGDDGYIYFGTNDGIMRVPESGGPVETVAEPGADAVLERPQLLPGGRLLLYTALTASGSRGTARVIAMDLESRDETTILDDAGLAVFAPSGPVPSIGHLVYGRDTALYAAPVDLGTLVAGAPSPVVDDLRGVGPIAAAGVSAAGTLAYYSGGSLVLGGQLSSVDSDGSVRPLLDTVRIYTDVSLSPDGRRAVVSVADLESFTGDLWLLDLNGSRFTRLTVGGVNFNGVWTPDGRRIVYSHYEGFTSGAPGELRSIPADNSAPPVTLATLPGGGGPTSISPDGKTVVGTVMPAQSSSMDIWALPLASGDSAGDTAVTDWLATDFNESFASFSPDGRWIAYASDHSGRSEIYVVAYPDTGGRYPVSTGGGSEPRWSSDGRRLFYRNGSRMMAVDVETDPAFSAGAETVVIDDPSVPSPADTNSYGFQYAVRPDGDGFVLLRTSQGGAQTQQLRVVQNWFSELRELAPLPKR